MPTIAIIACLALCWSIWIRRATLRPISERAKLTERTITVSLILQLCGLFLLSPASTGTVGLFLYTLSGRWNIDAWIGHCLYVSAAAMIVVNVKTRLDIPDDEIRARFHRHFALPMTVGVPVTLCLMMSSSTGDVCWWDFFDAPTDLYLDIYWTLICGYVIYTLFCAAVTLTLLRHDPRNRPTATLYLGGCIIGIAVCALHIVGTWIDATTYTPLFWDCLSMAAITFAYGAGQSWRNKTRQTESKALL